MNLLDWNSLAVAERIFAGIGFIALALVILQLVFSLLGGGDVHNYDMAAEHGDLGHTWGMFSIRGLFGFLLGLGWVGLIILQRGGGILFATLAERRQGW